MLEWNCYFHRAALSLANRNALRTAWFEVEANAISASNALSIRYLYYTLFDRTLKRVVRESFQSVIRITRETKYTPVMAFATRTVWNCIEIFLSARGTGKSSSKKCSEAGVFSRPRETFAPFYTVTVVNDPSLSAASAASSLRVANEHITRLRSTRAMNGLIISHADRSFRSAENSFGHARRFHRARGEHVLKDHEEESVARSRRRSFATDFISSFYYADDYFLPSIRSIYYIIKRQIYRSNTY